MTAGADPTAHADEAAGLALSDFEGRLGEAFAVETGAGAQDLELVVAAGLPGSLRPEGGFRLEFAGPAQTQLAQSIYVFQVGGAPQDIFIVPIGPGADRRPRYEAVFF